MLTRDKVYNLDQELRHKAGMTSDKFISEYCKIFRKYAYATEDNSLNEFEKEITHVLGMFIYHKRFCEIIGLENFDPRNFVTDYEENEQALKDKKEAIISEILMRELNRVNSKTSLDEILGN